MKRPRLIVLPRVKQQSSVQAWDVPKHASSTECDNALLASLRNARRAGAKENGGVNSEDQGTGTQACVGTDFDCPSRERARLPRVEFRLNFRRLFRPGRDEGAKQLATIAQECLCTLQRLGSPGESP
jgi:hypothetical protein